jgi:hypothetical protein
MVNVSIPVWLYLALLRLLKGEGKLPSGDERLDWLVRFESEGRKSGIY